MTRRFLCLVPLGAGLLLVAWPAAAQPTSKRALTLEDYYRIESVSGPAISPDGSRVAFVRTLILEDENRQSGMQKMLLWWQLILKQDRY